MARQMKDSGVEWIGEIPEDWECVKIKQLADRNIENSFVDGDWIESPYIEDEGIRYLTTGNIGDGVYKNQGNGYISLKTFDFLGCKYAYPGDLVFSRLNSPYGRSCILPHDFDKYVLAVDNVILRPLNNVIKRYVCFFSQCKGYQENVFDYAKGTTMKRISRSNLGNIFILLPSKDEQQKIADFLDEKVGEIDSVIAKTKETIEDYKKYKQAIITEAVTKGLNPDVEMKESGIDWIGKIPLHWKIVKLKSFTDIISKGATPKEISNEKDSMFYIRFLKSENIVNNVLIEKPEFYIETKINEEVLTRSQLNERDILFVIAGASIGKTAMMQKNFLPSNTNQAMAFLRISNSKLLYRKYIWYFLQSSVINTIIKLYSVQSAQPNLSMENLGNIKISLSEQSEEVEAITANLDERCSEIDKLIAKKEELIADLESYKKSFIYEYITGKKEVE